MTLTVDHIQAKNISQLFPPSITVDPEFDPMVKGISLDSRLIKDDYLFVARKGLVMDGRSYIDDAIRNGATVVLSERDNEDSHQGFVVHESGKPVYFADNIRSSLAEISGRFFEYPSKHLKVVGVTGTNGKTSVCYFLTQALNLSGMKTGFLGTIGNGFLGELEESKLTTGDVVNCYTNIAALVEQEAECVLMEVSSHSLDQGRVDGIDFDIAVFTNLTLDHLDYHADMEVYGACKKQLFLVEGLSSAVVNTDDAFGKAMADEMVADISSVVSVATVSSKNTNASLFITEALSGSLGVEFECAFEGVKVKLRNSNLFGLVNIENLALGLMVLVEMGFDFAVAAELLAQVEGVPGRLQRVSNPDNSADGSLGKHANKEPLVFVDYAHTPDALEKTLQSIQEFSDAGIILVFGCGGDRDQSKRPLMAAVAEKHCKKIIVTNDNPRTENADDIANDIVSGFKGNDCYTLELDREKAIKLALDGAKLGEVVVVAGKGHEAFQTIGNESMPFDDALVGRRLLDEMSGQWG